MKFFGFVLVIIFNAQSVLGVENLDELLDKSDRFGAMNYVQQKRKSEEKKLVPLIANQYFKQRTQELSELALSSWLRDRKEAEIKLNEALKLEPDNLNLLSMKWIILLEKKDCKAVFDEVIPWKKFEVLEVIKLFNSRIALCQAKQELELYPTKNYRIFWMTLEAQAELEKEHYGKAKTILDAVQKIDPLMPEIYFYMVKTSQSLKLPIDDFARKYLALCRNITHRQTREYLLQPFLCQRTKEIEGLLK